ncbi:hypothetical protein KC19_12G032500 [Ceratodon purpureus]|uniref:Protein kinase domain-containing protein n=1 Tax=Ceratodon purpureus TaxID=3225 RepID=A0A8T0G3A5_CERPU|nr:hypothetical protein KC19_12G032500 [Ceratodon purpureus]
MSYEMRGGPSDIDGDGNLSSDGRLMRSIDDDVITAVLEGDLNNDSKATTSEEFFPFPHSDWCPSPIAFAKYPPSKARSEQHAEPRELTVKLTKKIVDTYHFCNPSFKYSESYNPKRYLTVPFEGVSNNGLDNENHELILYVGQILANYDNTLRYVVKDIVGRGTFGQVARCLALESNHEVAVKIIKNQVAYSYQAWGEVRILEKLNSIQDKRNEHHVVRIFDHFSYEGHLCIVFELLGDSLYELLKRNSFKGVSLILVRLFINQLSDALSLLHDARVIHCDLKPENILLTSRSLSTADIKLIDFGSACMEEQKIYSYIQSRFYRAPEVVLGHAYSTAIDMWSLGCVAAELFLGFPLFPGKCAYDLLLFMNEKLGKQPPDHILRKSKLTNKYFKLTNAAPHIENGHTTSVYQFLTPEENETRENRKPVIGRRYMPGSLEEIIINQPIKPAGKEEMEEEMFKRKVFIDFLRGLLEVDPFKRWTAYEASQHPFLTGSPFTGSFSPLPHSPRDSLHPIQPSLHEGYLTGPLIPRKEVVPRVRIVGFDLGPMNEFGSFPEHNVSFGHASEGLLSHLPHRSDGSFTCFSPRTDAVPRARTSLGFEIEHNVSSKFRRSLSPHHPFTTDDPFIGPLRPRKEGTKRVLTPLGPIVEQNVSPGPVLGYTASLSPQEPFAETIDHYRAQWPHSLYMGFSDFLLLLCIFLEPISKIWTSLTDQGRLLVGFLVQYFRICIFGRYGKHVPSRHQWRVNSRDLKTNRFLGQGCSGIIYETTWSGREDMGILARKDFPAVKSDVFEKEAARLVELGDHPNIVKNFCWTIDRRSCSLAMEYLRYDLYSVVQKRKGDQRNAASEKNISLEYLLKVTTSPFELLTSIGLILKIATGMRYLHSRRIAHGDLKPNNILMSSEASPLLVKVADFGLINTKRRSTTLVSYRARCLQIVKWKAPELFKEYLGPSTLNLDNLVTGSDTDSDIVKISNDSNNGIFSNAGLRRADIYSFGLTCSHILGVQNWDFNLNWQELRKLISHGLRPQLPSGCPRSLASLISSCWAADPLRRPTFVGICKQLQVVKLEQMRHIEGHQIHYPSPNVRRPSTDKYKQDMKRRSLNVSRGGRRCKTAIPK